MSEGSSKNTCRRCAQAEELLSLVAGLREQVDRMRNICEPEETGGTVLCPQWNKNVN